jgi:hypothetical protein
VGAEEEGKGACPEEDTTDFVKFGFFSEDVDEKTYDGDD